MKDYIAQEMGEAVDWAAAAAPILKELDRQEGSQKSNSNDLKPRASELIGLCPSTNRKLFLLVFAYNFWTF